MSNLFEPSTRPHGKGDARNILYGLVACDVFLVVLHTLDQLTPWIDNPMFSLETDRGVPEIFQFLKFAWIVAALLVIARRKQSRRFVPWAALFTFLLADDAIGIHEYAGSTMGSLLPFAATFGLRTEPAGELAYAAIAGACFVLPILRSLRGADSDFRTMSRRLGLYASLLFFFGVVVDLAHSVWLFRGARVIEDGGEMFAVTLIAWHLAKALAPREAATGTVVEPIAVGAVLNSA